MLLPQDKSRPAQILQRPEAATGAGPLALDIAEYAAGNRLVLSGRADPGARVAVYAGNQLLGTVDTDAAGKWQLNSPLQRLSGATELRLDQLGRDGATAFQIALPLNPSGAASVAPIPMSYSAATACGGSPGRFTATALATPKSTAPTKT